MEESTSPATRSVVQSRADTITRRDALRTIAITGGTAALASLLAACGGGSSPTATPGSSALIIVGGKLALGPPAPMRAVRQIEARGFADTAVIGDWVSLHWGWVCEVITPRQRANLARFTDHQLRIANQTM